MKRLSNTDGACFNNVTLTVTPQQLIDALGNPDYFDNTGVNETNMKYNLETDDGIIFTIYDWKEYRSLPMNEPIEFRIGTFNYPIDAAAKAIVLNLIG